MKALTFMDTEEGKKGLGAGGWFPPGKDVYSSYTSSPHMAQLLCYC